MRQSLARYFVIDVPARLAIFYANCRVLITGGASFIGSHLAEMLVEARALVTVADDLSSGRLEQRRFDAFVSPFLLLRQAPPIVAGPRTRALT
jgi:nucleoside-diphosphate-sugar epimerase